MISAKKDLRDLNNFNYSIIAPIHLPDMCFFKISNLICLIILANGLMMNGAMATENNHWKYEAYLDLGYGHSFNGPDNNQWRSKSTTNKFGAPGINMAFAYLGKKAIKDSPWGMELGIQAGIDADNLIPSSSPDTNEPKANADLIRHLYRANATYRFPIGNGLKVSAGLINSACPARASDPRPVSTNPTIWIGPESGSSSTTCLDVEYSPPRVSAHMIDPFDRIGRRCFPLGEARSLCDDRIGPGVYARTAVLNRALHPPDRMVSQKLQNLDVLAGAGSGAVPLLQPLPQFR